VTRPIRTAWRNRRRRAIGAVLAGAIVVSGCGGGRSIVLYNGQHPQLTRALVAAFEKETGISVRVRTNNGIVLADQILQEGSGSLADVYLTENSPELQILGEHHLLAKLSPSTLGQIPPTQSSPMGDWAGVALRVAALTYQAGDGARQGQSHHQVGDGVRQGQSHHQVGDGVRQGQSHHQPPLPPSVLALAGPAWKGKVALAPTDSDFPPVVAAVSAKYGPLAAKNWLAGLKRNSQLFQDDESVVAAVNRGDVAVGVINAYYWYRLRLEVGAGAMRSAVHYFPRGDPGSVENISGAGVLASSAHQADAAGFVRFLVGPTAQAIIARGDDFEYPARPGVPANAVLPRLSSISPDAVGPALLGDDQAAARLIQEAGLA